VGRLISLGCALVAALILLVAAGAGVMSAAFGGFRQPACPPPATAPGTTPPVPAPGCAPVAVSVQGWTRPVPGEVVSGFRTPQRPDHDGVDISARRYTVIRAASAGVVVTVRCNVAGRLYPPTGGALPCDTDGYPGLGGCGWYLEIRHPGPVVSRYCHLVQAPSVRVGQQVTAGQPIGRVGSSGNSSGPHLHLQIHSGYPANESNATNPVSFLTGRGVAL
jgi:murein DD-endopeptidase MepM/ murein hydrolase activator NlpD